MYGLLRQFRDSPEADEVLDRVAGNDAAGRRVRGIHVGLDRYWAYWSARYRAQRMLERRAQSVYAIGLDTRDDWIDLSSTLGDTGLSDLDDLLKGTPEPPGWNDRCRARGFPEGSSPLYVRVLLRSPEDLREVANVELITNSRTPVEFVFMPPFVAIGGATVTVTFGGSIGQAQPARAGTLGGVLVNDSTGVAYAVTCAHVVDASDGNAYQPAPQDSRAPARIGYVSFEAFPQPLQAGENCTNRARGGSGLRDVDLALIELFPEVAYGPSVADTITPVKSMSQNSRVSFEGRSTQNGIAETGPLCLWDEVDVNGQTRCFGDIFTLAKPRPWYVNTDLVKGGDSGSWVIRHSPSGSAWWGMVIAGNGAHAYACFAENILETYASSGLGNLVLPP